MPAANLREEAGSQERRMPAANLREEAGSQERRMRRATQWSLSRQMIQDRSQSLLPRTSPEDSCGGAGQRSGAPAGGKEFSKARCIRPGFFQQIL